MDMDGLLTLLRLVSLQLIPPYDPSEGGHSMVSAQLVTLHGEKPPKFWADPAPPEGPWILRTLRSPIFTGHGAITVDIEKFPTFWGSSRRRTCW